MYIRSILLICSILWSINAMSQIDSTTILVKAFDHANKMKTALLSNDIKVVYEFLKSENADLPSFKKFKEETIFAYHDENYNYDSGLKNIILEKPIVYSYKDQVIQCVIVRKTILKYSDNEIITFMWYYSSDKINLKYENYSVDANFNKIQEKYPFIDLNLFNIK